MRPKTLPFSRVKNIQGSVVMRRTYVLCIAFAVCFCVFLSGCGESPSTRSTFTVPPTVPIKPVTIKNPTDLVGLEDEIKQAYFDEKSRQSGWDLTIDDVWIEKFCGVYNGYAAVLMFNTYIVSGVKSELEVVIDGVSFFYGPVTGAEVMLYKNSAFYDLQEAYEDGLLTDDDLKSIAYYQNEDVIFPGRTPKTPADGKTIWGGNTDQDFDDRNIFVRMDRNYNDWRFYAVDFEGVDVVRVRSLSVLRLSTRIPFFNYDDWRDILSIQIANPGKQNVFDAVRELEKLPFIEHAAPILRGQIIGQYSQ